MRPWVWFPPFYKTWSDAHLQPQHSEGRDRNSRSSWATLWVWSKFGLHGTMSMKKKGGERKREEGRGGKKGGEMRGDEWKEHSQGNWQSCSRFKTINSNVLSSCLQHEAKSGSLESRALSPTSPQSTISTPGKGVQSSLCLEGYQFLFQRFAPEGAELKLLANSCCKFKKVVGPPRVELVRDQWTCHLCPVSLINTLTIRPV